MPTPRDRPERPGVLPAHSPTARLHGRAVLLAGNLTKPYFFERCPPETKPHKTLHFACGSGEFQTIPKVIFAMRSALAIACGGQIERVNMQWRIRGASSTTGIDSSTLLEAVDVEQARDFANQRGILVSSIESADASLDLIAASTRSVVLPSTSVNYPALDNQSRWAASLGTFFNGIGWILLIATTMGAVVALFAHANYAEFISMADLVRWIVTAIVITFFFLTAGAILRMLAYIGQAVRDIAINSRR